MYNSLALIWLSLSRTSGGDPETLAVCNEFFVSFPHERG